MLSGAAQRLCIPGPTPIPARVVRASARPMINPRGPEFAALLADCVAGVRWALGTANDVLMFPASGTGGLEAAVASLLSPGERALFCTSGWFGELWADIARAYGADVACVRSRPGRPVDVAEVAAALDREPAIEKLFVTHNETSTGVLNDVPAIAAVARERDRLVVVDSVSGVPCHPLAVDALGLDVVITASQKGWLAPPGLTMLAVSERALRAAARARCPSWYFDFARQRDAHARGMLLTTPPISVMHALQEGIAMLREEGLDAVWRRHRRVAALVRAGLADEGLRPVARSWQASSTVTAVWSPFAEADALAALLHDLRTEHGLVVADALGELAGRAFRIGHLGAITPADAGALLAALHLGLAGAALAA